MLIPETPQTPAQFETTGTPTTEELRAMGWQSPDPATRVDAIMDNVTSAELNC